MTLPESDEPKYCVTLVHGTFAPNAPWTQAGSLLRTTLQSHLDGPVNFSAPDWGGANSPRTRREAADQLASHITHQAKIHPQANHFIVGHSHGGNVALMASYAHAVASRLKGLICLATPFLTYTPRRFMPYLSLLVFSAFACLFLGVVVAISRVLPEGETSTREEITVAESTPTAGGEDEVDPNSLVLLLGRSFAAIDEKMGIPGVVITLTGTCLFFPWLSLLVTRRICKRIECLQSWSADLYRMPERIPFRVLTVFIPFDEARLWLRGLWWMAEVPFKMNTFLIGMYGLLGIVGLVLYLPKGLVAMSLDCSPMAWIWCGFWGVLAMGIVVALVSAATQAVMFLCVFVRGHRWGFGWEGWTASWLGRITARKKPPVRGTDFDVLKVKADEIAGEIGGRVVFWKLRHSLLYESPTVVKEIAAWMKQQTAPPVTGRPK